MEKTIKLDVFCLIFLCIICTPTISFAKKGEEPLRGKEVRQQAENFKLNTEISRTVKPVESNNYEEIEKIFSRKNLKQYGYNVFNSKISLSSAQAPANYKLKEGDSLNVYFWGDSIDLLNISANGFLSPVNSVSVDNQGNIFINGVGVIEVKGRTPAEAEKIIAGKLSQKIDSFQVKVNVANSENFPIIITGNVKNPGTFYINNDLSLIDILSMSGGINKNGSLRSILHISNNKKNEIDLYDFLIKGKSYNKEFKRNDVILVKPIGNVVAIDSGVKNPAIYEFKQGETLKDLVEYSGGLLPSVKSDVVTIETFDGGDFKKKIVNINYNNIGSFFPHNGDVVKFRVLFDSSANIEVSGCIQKPGLIPYRQNMTLKDILNSVEFKKNTEIHLISNSTDKEIDVNNIAAEISTKTETGNPEIKTVYLYSLLTRNQQDVVLRPDDKVLFRELAENENLKSVEILGYVKKPGVIKLYPDMKLSDAIKIAGGIAKEGHLEGLILFRPSISEEQKQILEKAMLDLDKGILEVANKSQIVPNEDKDFLSTQKELVKIMEKKADRNYGRISLNIKSENPDELTAQEDIILQDGDKIYVPIRPQHIMIVGEVLNPSAIAFSSGKTFNNYIDDVGGLTKEADKRKIYISRANGFSQRVTTWNKVSLKPGDSIIIPRKITKPVDWFEFSKNFATLVANTLNTIFIIVKI